MMSQLTLVVAVVVTVLVADGDGEALGEGLAAAPSAVWLMVEWPLPESATTTPMVRPSTTGMATGTAKRATRLRLPRRRAADRCPMRIYCTSMSFSCSRAVTVGRGRGYQEEYLEVLISSLPYLLSTITL
jgi:hypothetical protein